MLKAFRRGVLVLAALTACMPAQAQTTYSPPAGVPLVTINGTQYGVWAYDTGFIGANVGVFKLTTAGWENLVPTTDPDLQPDQNFASTVTTAGGASAWLASKAPEINKIFASAVASAPITGNGTYTPTGNANLDPVNAALNSGYSLQNQNGIPTLVANPQ